MTIALIHAWIFLCLCSWTVPGSICSDKNPPVKLTISFNPIGDNKENLKWKEWKGSDCLLFLQDCLDSGENSSVNRTNLHVAFENGFVNSAVCLSSWWASFTVRRVALNSPLFKSKEQYDAKKQLTGDFLKQNWSWCLTCRIVNFLKESPAGYVRMTWLL